MEGNYINLKVLFYFEFMFKIKIITQFSKLLFLVLIHYILNIRLNKQIQKWWL